MKALKFIGLGLVVVIAIFLIIAAFVKKEYTLEREITINKPKAAVFSYIKMLKNQNYYSKWNMTDPNAKMDYRGTDGTVGFVATWDSQMKNVGKGEQEITAITEGERMDVKLHFFKPFDGIATAYFTTEAVGENQTKVKWGFNGNMPYPMNLMLLTGQMQNMLGGDLQIGLNNLKANLEKQ